MESKTRITSPLLSWLISTSSPAIVQFHCHRSGSWCFSIPRRLRPRFVVALVVSEPITRLRTQALAFEATSFCAADQTRPGISTWDCLPVLPGLWENFSTNPDPFQFCDLKILTLGGTSFDNSLRSLFPCPPIHSATTPFFIFSRIRQCRPVALLFLEGCQRPWSRPKARSPSSMPDEFSLPTCRLHRHQGQTPNILRIPPCNKPQRQLQMAAPSHL